jgi:hypothetical protein
MRHRQHGIAAHPIAPQPGNQIATERIVADTPGHGHPRAQPRRGHRLVRSLAAGGGEEVRAEHGLPGARQLIAARNEIHVQAADHQDRLGTWHPLARVLSSRRRERRMGRIWRRFPYYDINQWGNSIGTSGRRHRG